MGEFDEFVRSEPKEVPPEDKRKAEAKASSHRSASTGKSKSLTELLVGEEDAHQFAERFGLDEEMTSKVLVPLLNFLDKYEIGQGITDNPTAQGVLDLSTVVADVAPVVKNAAEYFSGRSATLSEDDAAFLAKIRESQGDGMDLFFNEDEDGMEIGELAEEEPELPAAPIYTGAVPIDADPFGEGLDWATILDAPEFRPKNSGSYTYTDLMPKPDLMIKGLDDLAKEAGLDPQKVKSSDTQHRINSGSQSTAQQIALAEGDASGIELDLASIKSEMEAEKAKQKRTSKVLFDEANAVMVPDNLEAYDPLNVPGFTLPPTPQGNLETLEEMNQRMAEMEEDEDEEDEPEVDTTITEVGTLESDYFGAVSLGDGNDEEE
tara:strand:+ start:3115 stop:4245 length:1131 start_codon:yes stop_codon:yes gene_type:complete